MSDQQPAPDWWLASDGKWYPPEQHPAAAAAPPAPPAPPAPQVSPAPPPAPQVPPQVPQQLPPPTLAPPAAPRRSRKGLVAGVVGVVAAGAIGVVAYSVLRGEDGGSGGFETPEAAVEAFVSSLDDEDTLGVAASIDPDDLGGAAELLGSLAEGDGGGAGLPGGVELEIDLGDPEAMTIVELGDTGDLVRAELPSLTVTLRRTDEPPQAVAIVQDFSLDVLSSAEFEPGSAAGVELTRRGGRTEAVAFGPDGQRTEPELADVALDVFLIRKRGDWYVSPTYTVAELVRQVSDLSGRPDYGAWQDVLEAEGSGGDDPAAAVDEFVESVVGLDLDRVVELVDPVETRVLHDYWPVIDAQIDPRELDEARAETRITVDSLELRQEEEDGRTVVVIDEVVLSSVDDFGDRQIVSLDSRWCWSFDDGFDFDRGCLSDQIDEALEGSEIEARGEEVLALPPSFVVTEREGRWFVSPFATLALHGGSAYDALVGDGTDGLGTGDRDRADVGDLSIFEATPILAGEEATLALGAAGTRRAGAWEAVAVTPAPDGDTEIPDWFGERAQFVLVEIDTDAPVEAMVGGPNDLAFVQGGERVVVEVGPDELRTFGVAVRSVGDSTSVVVRTTVLPATVIGAEGALAGSIGQDGLPQVYVVRNRSDETVNVDGAELQAGFLSTRSEVVRLDREPRVDHELFSSQWLVVSGEPGASFDLTIDAPPVVYDEFDVEDTFRSLADERGYDVFDFDGVIWEDCGASGLSTATLFGSVPDGSSPAITHFFDEFDATAYVDSLATFDGGSCPGPLDGETFEFVVLAAEPGRVVLDLTYNQVDDLGEPVVSTFVDTAVVHGNLVLYASGSDAAANDAVIAALQEAFPM